MYRLIILLILTTQISPVFADIINSSPNFSRFPSKINKYNSNSYASQIYTPQRNYGRNKYRQKIYKKACPQCHSHNYYHQPIKINNLKRLEKHVFDRTFNNEDDITRLERLENLAFGAIQDGDLSTRYHNIESAIYSRPKYKTSNLPEKIL